MGARAAAVLSGTALLLGASTVLAQPASAEGSFVTPGAGASFSGGSVRLEARIERFTSSATELVLVDPAGVRRTMATAPATGASASSLTATLDTACPAGCSGPTARNGSWTAELTGGAQDRTTFTLAVPPAQPRDVRAEAQGTRDVVVTWSRGREPDLVGYDVVTPDGRVLVPGDTSCPGGTCRTVVSYGTDGPSTEDLAVRVSRSACPDCEGRLTATSAPVSVARPAVAPAAESPRGAGPETASDGPSAAPGAGGAGAGGAGAGAEGAGTGGSGTGAPGSEGAPGGAARPSTSPTSAPGAGTSTPGSGQAGRPQEGGTGTSGAPAVAGSQAAADAFALSFRAFGPKIGLPKLPPLPATGVALPAVAGVDETDGAFAPELPFGEQVVTERVPTTALGPAQRLTRSVGAALDGERLARGVAGGLVLLLVGAHVRRWLGQAPAQD